MNALHSCASEMRDVGSAAQPEVGQRLSGAISAVSCDWEPRIWHAECYGDKMAGRLWLRGVGKKRRQEHVRIGP